MGNLSYEPPVVAFSLSPSRWVEKAVCTEKRLGVSIERIDELFFPGRGQTIARARAICAACPVKIPCLEFALASGTVHGVFGGMSYRERMQIARERS